LACCCADEFALPLGIIYAADTKNIQSTWVDEVDVRKHEVFVSVSPSGWSNNDIGLAWLEQVFERNTAKKARRRYRLLILDGHSSHLTEDFLGYCHQHKILLAVYPPHSTHTLQPLDVVMFKPLSTAYSKAVLTRLHCSRGLLSIKKGDFFGLFWDAWISSFTEINVLNSFKATGIALLNPTLNINFSRSVKGRFPSIFCSNTTQMPS
jgi:hypothetical protein